MTSSTTKLSNIFDIEYGNQYDLNKMKEPLDANGVAFVSRKSGDLGFKTFVARTEEDPYPAGYITVALGGSVLTSSVQQSPFYTSQNIMVLEPKEDLYFREKVYYCMCIEENKYRYSAMGREANKSLKDLQIPSSPPSWLENVRLDEKEIDKTPLKKKNIDLYSNEWGSFLYKDLFDISRGKGPRIRDTPPGETPMVTATTQDNGINSFLDHPPTHPGGVISVARNGNGVGAAFYQPVPFCSNEDVHVFEPKFDMDVYIAFFFITLIRKEAYRYHYGRKWGVRRMENTEIQIPITEDEEPDYDFIREYVMSLKFSRNLKQEVEKPDRRKQEAEKSSQQIQTQIENW